MCGHCEDNAIVMPRLSMMRAGLITELNPGIGTNTKTPATRTSVNRKPNRVDVEKTSSPPIAAEVSENRHRVRAHLLHHPRQRQDERAEECEQPGDGVE